MSRPSEAEYRFVQSLQRLANPERPNRGALARLRRGLAREPGADLAMSPYVAPYVPPGARAWEEDCYYLVAALFAWHPQPWSGGTEPWKRNLGASFARMAAEERRRTGSESNSIEQRFTALLNCHPDDLHLHLRQAISLLATREVPVDWAWLLHHVIRWDDPRRSVQREWARSFWTGHEEIPGESLAAAE